MAERLLLLLSLKYTIVWPTIVLMIECPAHGHLILKVRIIYMFYLFQPMGTWSLDSGFTKASDYEHREIPRFFRIGTVPKMPWAFIKTDNQGNELKDENVRLEL